jgi:predicted acetyltransferase
MRREDISLIEPTSKLAEDFCAMAAEFLAEGDDRYRQAMSDVGKFLESCVNGVVGADLPPGRVPWSTFWLVRDNQRILGCSRLRHKLNTYLAQEGGHIGYDVRPSERGKGYATQLLRLTLEKAGQLGLTRVLITADTANVASWRVIEKNLGVIEGESVSAQTGNLMRRYWIAL